jgi:hypothetical protein
MAEMQYDDDDDRATYMDNLECWVCPHLHATDGMHILLLTFEIMY